MWNEDFLRPEHKGSSTKLHLKDQNAQFLSKRSGGPSMFWGLRDGAGPLVNSNYSIASGSPH